MYRVCVRAPHATLTARFPSLNALTLHKSTFFVWILAGPHGVSCIIRKLYHSLDCLCVGVQDLRSSRWRFAPCTPPLPARRSESETPAVGVTEALPNLSVNSLNAES